MDNIIKQIIEEKFVSKKQQKYFYAKANDKTLSKKERNKWAKLANEFSEKTNFKKLPEKIENDIDEVVDEDGNIISKTIPDMIKTKGITSKFTTDQEAGMSQGMMGAFGIGGPINTSRTLKYWAEADMSKSLGYQDTLAKDENYEEALDHFENDLGLDDKEAEERIEKMGYDENLPDGKVRLIERPKEFIEEYIDNILKNRSKSYDLVNKNQEIDEVNINPIVLRQLKSLKQSLKDNEININDAINFLKNE